jgi:hypothetical protein
MNTLPLLFSLSALEDSSESQVAGFTNGLWSQNFWPGRFEMRRESNQ